LYLPTLSWAGDELAFYWDKTGRNELYVLDLATRAVRQVSHGEVPRALRAGFLWDRTDRSIVFAKDVGGNEQHDLFRIDVETGAVVQITHDPATQEYPVDCSPDNHWLTVVSNRRPAGLDHPAQLNVWKLRPDGTDYEPVTRCPFPALGGHWSPNGQWLSFTTNEAPGNLRNRDGYVVHPDGTGMRRVLSVRAGSQDLIGDWHPDSEHLAVTSDASGVNRAGVLDLGSGEVRWLTPEGVEERAGRFSASGRSLVCLRNQAAQVRPVVYDLHTGEPRELNLPPGVAEWAQFPRDETQLLVSYSADTTTPSLLAYDLRTDSYETLLGAEYDAVAAAAFVEAADVEYPSLDGTQIPALLFAPTDLASGARRPAIVHLHGGPSAQWHHGFDPFAQFLVDRGYVVLEPNVRGSTGYGVAFRDAILHDWGGRDLDDVAAAARYLESLPFVDPTRLVVFGGSYGGFLALLALTKQPELWRAGIAWNGISDLRLLYDQGMEFSRYFLREQIGDPDANVALWSERSAINFADNLRANLLLIHGVNDPRCPVDQSRVLRDRLLALGRREGSDFAYAELTDEGHGSSDIEQKIRTFELVADYLERVLQAG
jgi:dipeptidyl aminopeptidase/acylaminoacyl peptidase